MQPYILIYDYGFTINNRTNNRNTLINSTGKKYKLLNLTVILSLYYGLSDNTENITRNNFNIIRSKWYDR